MVPSSRLAFSATFFALFVLCDLYAPVFAQDNPKTSNPQTSKSLTLSKAIEIALSNQPSLVNAAAQKQSAQERITQAKTRFQPTATVSSTYQKSYAENLTQSFAGGVQVQQVTVGRNASLSQQTAGLNWRLLDNGQRKLALRQAEQGLDSATFSEKNTIQTVIGNVSDAYFSVLRNEAIVRVNQAQVARTKQLLEQVNAQISAGTAAAKDYLQPESDYLNAQVNVLNAQVSVDIAYAQLRNAMGMPSMTLSTLADVASAQGDLPITAQFVNGKDEAETIQKLVAQAVQNRPDIALSRQTIETNQIGVEQAKLALRPTMSVDTGIQEQLNSNYQLLKRNGNNRQIGVSVSYPVFDGGNLRSQARVSEQTVRTSEAQLRTTEQQVIFEVEQAYRNLRQAQITLPATEKAQTAAQNNYERAQTAQQVGTGPLTDVIIAQTTLTQAQLNAVQALYNYYSADARLARSLGQAERIGVVAKAK
jgi:outer membrane protein